MTRMDEWRKEFYAEIARAESARAKNNEGQARVCARRAAGAVVREYFKRMGIPVRRPSAHEVLKLLAEQSHLSPPLKRAADLLILRVDEEFKLPNGVDLIDEAHRLKMLLNE